MPTRNRAGDLLNAARSVLSQAGADLELVIVDDASDDSTSSVLDSLSEDSRVRVRRNDRSLGPSAARNRGLEDAQGELLAFCDDDDAWLPGAAATMVGFLEDDKEVGAASAWHRVLHRGSGRAVDFRGPLAYGEKHLLWYNVVAVPFVVIRRAAFSFPIRFDPELRTGEDWDLCLRCAQERRIGTVPSVAYQYTQHRSARMTRAPEDHARGRLAFVAKHGERMPPACRLYHQAVVDLQEGGLAGALKRLAPGGGAHLSSAGRAAAVLWSNVLASRLGVRLGDPGLAARVTTKLVEAM